MELYTPKMTLVSISELDIEWRSTSQDYINGLLEGGKMKKRLENKK